MLVQDFEETLRASKAQGWIMEPEAKRLLSLVHLEVPSFKWTDDVDVAVRFAGKIGYPVVAKVVSPAVVHKSEHGGVVPRVGSEKELRHVFSQFSRVEPFAGILVEERLSGLELIIGGKMDYQFGPAEVCCGIRIHEVYITDKDSSHTHQAVQYGNQFRHLCHLHLHCQDDANGATNQHADENDHIDIDLWTQHCRQDSYGHAGNTVSITPA